MYYRHLTEVKTQLAVMKDMLRQQRAVRQQTSEPVAVGSRLDSSAAGRGGGLSQPGTDQAASRTWPQWYDCVHCSR